jgi:hypothetical protein
MSGGMNGSPLLNNCTEVAPLLIFYACDEVEPHEREQIDAHLAQCETCRGLLGEESELQTALSGLSQTADAADPTGTLLAQCRSELSEKLDDLEVPKVREHWLPFGWVQRWMALRPAWSAAGLIVFGVAIGTQLVPWLAVRSGGGDDRNTAQAMNVTATPRLTDEQLSKMAVAGITFAPAPDAAPGTLQVQVRTEQPLVVVGSVDDEDVRRLLTFVVANGERFDPGTRLDCLDAVKARTDDEHVRNALVKAARKDKNDAVRLKALDALRDYTHEIPVRDALLDALHHDVNPGVRVEAVNLLVNSLGGDNNFMSAEDSLPVVAATPANAELAPINGDGEDVGRVVRALEDLQRRDPNRYVRMRSAAALRQIGSRDMQ